MATPAKRTRKSAAKPDPFSPQQQLAPAPVAPAANDEARLAIATINTQLSEFDKVEAGLSDLEKRYAKVAYPVDTKKGMDEAVLARREIKGVRVSVEHARKAAKAPILALGRNIDERAGKITARLTAIEDPIHDQITAQEEKEAKRKADLERRVTEIRNTPQQCIGKTSAQLKEVLDALESLPLAEFEEYREQAAKAQFDAQQAVRTLHQQAVESEELAELREKQRREENRKASIQQAIDAIGAPLQQLPMCRTAARVQALIDNVTAVAISPEVYQEFAPAAREKKAEVLAELTRVRDEKQSAEDARAQAATQKSADPAPTPAPAPAAAPAPELHRPVMSWDAEDAFAGAKSTPQPDPQRASTMRTLPGPGRALGDHFNHIFRGTPPAPRCDVAPETDPFSDPLPPARSEMSLEQPQRPNDAEILAVVADHYEVDAATAAGWLRTFDAAAALAQQSLLPTT